MAQTDLQRFTEACNYPGHLDEKTVESHLTAYLQVLGVERRIERLRSGWLLYDHPPLKRSIDAILDDFAKRSGRTISDALAALDARDARAARAARDALDARDARDALDALDARDARDALNARAARDGLSTALTSIQRFAAWCVQRSWWWYDWDISWVSCTYFGARELKNKKVEAWSRPLFEAFVAGCWSLYWTDDTLYWIAKPAVHRDPAPGTRRLHNEYYAAIESDIENLYFWHGVLVPAFVVVRPDWITVKHIDGETNAEVRRVMIERYKHGEEIHAAAAYMRDAGGKRLDHDERFGTLWHRDVPDDEPIVMLEVTNSTREPDGHFKHYWLRVDPQIRPLLADNQIGQPQKPTALNAAASTFGMTGKQYAPSVET